ncbi:MAG: protein kinase domain-containing protein [Acidimicrobiia bacterium]
MSDTLTAGRVLGGRYRLVEPIARGGMATVWLADDPVLARRVAVKVLRAELGANGDLRTRFQREAVAAARLSHSGIVATYDTGDDDGVAYIVMELVEGTTVRRLLDSEGALSIPRSVDLSVQVADALQHAHQQGLVHRDIKPGNVLVTHHDRVKVTDFGIAKLTGDDDLTRTGTVLGTARYLAPEQVNGGVIDARTDVYALGLLVYEMMCGNPPFAAETDMATAVARLTNDAPSLRRYRPELAPELDAVVTRALARDPDRRFESAAEFRRALAGAPRATLSSSRQPARPRLTLPASPGAPTEARSRTSVGSAPPVNRAPARTPARRPSRSRRGLLVIGALFLAGCGVAASLLWPFDDGDNPTTSEAAAVLSEPLTIAGVEDFDPDGDGEEHAEEAANGGDGDTTTSWSSETYANEAFGNGKSGVGLIVDLGSEQQVTAVTVSTAESGWSGEVYLATEPGESFADWGSPVAGPTEATAADPVFQLGSPTVGRYVLVWFTELPSSRRMQVNEVTVEGLA